MIAVLLSPVLILLVLWLLYVVGIQYQRVFKWAKGRSMPSIHVVHLINDAYGDDERFLEDWAYPRTAALEHSAYGVVFQNPIRAFPSDRIGQEYVGEPFRAPGK